MISAYKVVDTVQCTFPNQSMSPIAVKFPIEESEEELLRQVKRLENATKCG